MAFDQEHCNTGNPCTINHPALCTFKVIVKFLFIVNLYIKPKNGKDLGKYYIHK